MEKKLQEIDTWANMGTIRQFQIELSARLADEGDYDVQLEGDTLRVYENEKEGGFLGIGARKSSKLVLEVRKEGEQAIVQKDSVDLEFVDKLNALLEHH